MVTLLKGLRNFHVTQEAINKEPWKVFPRRKWWNKTLHCGRQKGRQGDQVRAVPGAQAREGADRLLMTMKRQRAGQTWDGLWRLNRQILVIDRMWQMSGKEEARMAPTFLGRVVLSFTEMEMHEEEKVWGRGRWWAPWWMCCVWGTYADMQVEVFDRHFLHLRVNLKISLHNSIVTYGFNSP